MTYEEFLRRKIAVDAEHGDVIAVDDVHPMLKPHQRDIVCWAVRGGRRAIFAAFGLGKSLMQLEALRLCLRQNGGGRALIVAPLAVRQEFRRDAALIGLSVKFIRSTDEIEGDDGIYITNYESVREGKIDANLFVAVSLDEASCLRGFGGTKTFREFMRLFEHNPNNRFRFVATATPSPNDYIELLAYAAFLEIMDVGEAKTRFFKRNSEKADQLTIHPHKEREFWLWCASWAIFLQRPSDIGHSDAGYELPPIEVRWHRLPVDHKGAGEERDGQLRMYRNASLGLSEAAAEKRRTMDARINRMTEIVGADPADHFIIWHDLEDERHAIAKALPGVAEVYGSLDLDTREQRILDFSDGKIQYLATKPRLSGSGCNLQRHCHRAIFLGIGFKFNDLIQAVHRIQRFLQAEPVIIDLIYSESEDGVRKVLERKWRQHEELTKNMTAIIQEYGLSNAGMIAALARSIGVERVAVTGRDYEVVNNDCVLECKSMPDSSVDLIITSIPFSTQYEYTPSYNDFGHTESNEHFWQQMDYLTPELLRILEPGRVAAIHVKDRITPGGINGLGFQTVTPFSDECVAHFRKHGFGFLARKTVVTDVVRENKQTYRLGWTEQCKDGSRMGAGMPEYVLLFRKPPTDRSNGYADVKVVKRKPDVFGEDGITPVAFTRNGAIVPGSGYSRSRWQIDAHGFMRSSGNRHLTPEEIESLPHEAIFKLFRDYSMNEVYDFEHHVRLGEQLEMRGILPVTFMLLQPQSWHPDVWTDVTRMRTLNGAQHAKGKEMHLCPLQFDIVNRLIAQLSMEGETVFDPFGGLMTVPKCAIELKRKGRGVELNPSYFLDGAGYCSAAEREMSTPTLFDLVRAESIEAHGAAA